MAILFLVWRGHEEKREGLEATKVTFEDIATLFHIQIVPFDERVGYIELLV